MALGLWLISSLILHSASPCNCKITNAVISRFHISSKNEEFQHLVIDSETGILYAGATNSLYQLEDSDAGLRASHRYQTGPELDSPLCNHNGDCILWSSTPSKKPPIANKTLIDNHNQIMLLYPAGNALIACGTLKQGVCTLHHLENISRTFSDIDRSVPVAANSVNATTVAFLGPDSTLYVAATFTYDAYRDAFPAVCTRTLSKNRPFQLVDPGDVIGQSGLMIRNEYRFDFRIYYVGGFHFDQYAFWISVQRKSVIYPSSPFVSKLLRVCVDDVRYETYSELPLECLGADNSQYNVMKAFYTGRLGVTDRADDREYLIGVFTKSADPWKIDPKQHSSHSAICVFSLKDIQAAFMYSLQRCNSGIGKWNLPHFGFDQKCHNITGQQRMPNRSSPNDNSCQPLRVGSDMPATSAALITYFGPLLTSIAVDVIGNRTALFVGTRDGKLKKINLRTIKIGREYGEIQLSSGHDPGVWNNRFSNWTSAATTAAVNPDMVLDSSRRHLYVITKKELLKVAVESCGSYETCDICLASGDPYCGWCTLENRCSRKDDCSSSNIEYGFLPSISHDLSSFKNACPTIEHGTSMNASLRAPAETQVFMNFNFLPSPPNGGFYRCIFGVNAVLAEFVSPRTLKCHLPPVDHRLKENGGAEVRLQLKIWASSSNSIFYETPFVFYDCGASKRCTSCVSSKWPCNWCILENKCTDISDTCLADAKLIATAPVWPSQHFLHQGEHSDFLSKKTFMVNSTGINRRISQCPRIDTRDFPEMLIPSGQSFAIQIPVANLDTVPDANKIGALDCVTIIDRKEIRVRGWLSENGRMVVCENHAYAYEAVSRTATADFYLQTGTGAIIDQIKVHLYKCEMLGPDCTRCQSVNRRYQCGWCNGRCQHRKSCTARSATSVDDPGVCPPPLIKTVSPLAGPVEGGTRLEIIGLDMGLRREHVQGRVSIGGKVLCDVVEYTPAERIVCITRPSATSFDGALEIRLGNNRELVVRSQRLFRFVHPSVDGFHPNMGPRSGGTEVVISGTHLLDATRTRVFIGTLPCKIDGWKSTSEHVICKTSASNQDQQTFYELTVLMDRANRSIVSRFDYTPDPRVASVQPLVSFRSGGRRLIIRGRNFNSVQRPLMFLLETQTGRLASENSICQVLNATLMLCPSPALLPGQRSRSEAEVSRRTASDQFSGDGSIRRFDDAESEKDNSLENAEDAQDETRNSSGRGRFHIGFIMDDVESVRRSPEFTIDVVSDPAYFPFPNGRKFVKRDEPLILEGANLNLSCSESDIKVTVGSDICKIVRVSATQLVCQPPNSDVPGPLVVVRVGYLEFVLGKLIYQDSDGDSRIWDAVSIAAIVCVCATLLAAAAMALWWRRKTWKARKEYERVHLHDSSESNARQEYRPGLSKQSDILAPTTGPHAVPYQCRRVFAEKVLFRDDKTVKSLSSWRECDDVMSDSIIAFEEILGNGRFLSILVGVLEQDMTTTASDRAYVAGLLTMSLSRDMYQLTELVMVLLREEIVKHSHQSESKSGDRSISGALLINWLSLSMYDYLLESGQGSALFVLHKTLKCQSEAGPTDAVTGHAKYSLSEEGLLKERVDFESIVLRIIPPSTDNDCDAIPCRVLTCDTIGQVKSKILDILYRDAPLSIRPAIEDIELEWRCKESRTGIFLQDDDFNGAANCKEYWRQLNTIQHYGVPNQAVIAVFLKMRSGFPHGDDSTNTYVSISSSTYLLSGSSVSSSSSPNGNVNASSRDNRYSSASTQNARSIDRPAGSIGYWHLAKPTSSDSGYGSRASVSTSEIHFSRLLACKGAVQQDIDSFFRAIFTNDDSCFPLALNYLFDVLDDEAGHFSFADPTQTTRKWKTELYFLKFWSHLILNIDSLLDVDQKPAVQCCMAVVEEVLADMCAYPMEHSEKDPTSKMLFARDSPRYRRMLAKFLDDVGNQPRVDECELRSQMAHLSKTYCHDLYNAGAVQELFTYVVGRRERLLNALCQRTDPEIKTLAQRFDRISAWADRHSVV